MTLPSPEEARLLSVAELKRLLLDGEPPARDEGTDEALLAALEQDGRRAARDLARRVRARRERGRAEEERLTRLLEYESELWGRGVELVAGVDEAGMAPLAGAVVAAAVILPRGYRLPGLNDSKKVIGEEKRRRMAERIKQDAICWAVGRAEVEEIDRLNIYHAGLLAMHRAVEGLSVKPAFALVDARHIPGCPCPQRGIVGGDALSASIAAASVIAKTTRDAYMAELDRLYPGYGLAAHKGYPTPQHYEAIRRLGVTPVHRRSFAPVREALDRAEKMETS